MTDNMNQEKYLNKLIASDQNIGIIRYVGRLEDLPNDTSLWFGIEWKDPSRGKHDGSYKNKRYFTTKHPKGGSFVKINKIDFGTDIWKAAYEKYFCPVDFDQKANKQDQDEFIFNTFNNMETNSQLKNINLSNCNISDIGTFMKLEENFKQMVELDLENNLIGTWDEILDALNGLKSIKVANLSNNMLKFPEKFDESKVNHRLNGLILNRMNYNWSDVLKVIGYFPCLVELKLCFNIISQIDIINENLINKLRLIDLESNPINEWRNLLKLGELRELEELYASNIGISTIFFDDCDRSSKTKYFPQLKVLVINQNKINDWNSVNELNKLKNLVEIRFRLNPLSNSEQIYNVREMFIAKLEKLQIFNRTLLDKFTNERKGAELDYLKKYGKEWLELCNLNENDHRMEEFLRQHPRYPQLVKIHGAAEKSESENQPDVLKNKLINLKLKNAMTGQIIERKFPLTVDIQRLKLIISKLFKLNLSEMDTVKLSYVSQKNKTEYPLDNEMRNLEFYALEENDTITIADSS